MLLISVNKLSSLRFFKTDLLRVSEGLLKPRQTERVLLSPAKQRWIRPLRPRRRRGISSRSCPEAVESWLIWQFLFWDKRKGLIVRTSPESTTSSHELRVARGPLLHDLSPRVARLYRGLVIIIT